MNYPEIGQTVEIHSYKHNSKIHRIWHETTIIDSSVLVAFGETCTFVGALLGIDYTYKY